MGRIALVSLIVGGGALGLLGCGDGNSSALADKKNFEQLTTLYATMVKWGVPPKSEAEFKAALDDRLKPVVEAIKVSDVSALFVGRDGKPITIIYGAPPPGVKSDVFAYEQDGVDGKRLVAFALGTIEEADEQRFRELVPSSAAN